MPFFRHTHTHTRFAVGLSECERQGRDGDVHCFWAFVQCLLNPHVLSVQLYPTNEMGDECACAYDGSCHSC